MLFKRGQKVRYNWVCTKCGQERTTYDGAYDKIKHSCCGSVYNLELKYDRIRTAYQA